MKSVLGCSVLCISLVLCGCSATDSGRIVRVGIQDKTIEYQISRSNDIAGRYKNKDFIAIEKVLSSELSNIVRGDSYARQHILNELSDIYSYHLHDIERAVEIDQEITALGIANNASPYRLQHDAANQHILYAKDYRDNYLNITSEKILENARNYPSKEGMTYSVTSAC